MSIVRVGATKQFSDNWENIFNGGGRKSATKKVAAKQARKSPKKAAKAKAKAVGKKSTSRAKRKSR